MLYYDNMEDFVSNEQNIEAAIKYLKYHDPENADREYAIELLRSMQETAKELVDKNLEFAQLIEIAFKKKCD